MDVSPDGPHGFAVNAWFDCPSCQAKMHVRLPVAVDGKGYAIEISPLIRRSGIRRVERDEAGAILRVIDE